jgi:NTP pyrophosphatase (non-canonical NTP hydrolase)
MTIGSITCYVEFNNNNKEKTMETALNQYASFVSEVTSNPSKNKEDFIARINELYDAGCDVARLTTAGIGLTAEGGEFNEIVKKILFQGKEYNEDNRFHMMRELGDILWYWTQAAIALGVDPYEILDENVRKLEARYPGGKFSIVRSEVREIGDI